MEFTQSLFSGDESSGMVEARLMASGFSQWPYEVVIMPTQSDPPNALGIYLFNNFIVISHIGIMAKNHHNSDISQLLRPSIISTTKV